MPEDFPRKTAPRDADPRALGRISRRLALADAPPWLHGEAARRMGDRLAVVKRQPGTVVDWSGHAGAGQAVLRAAYPQARHVVVESDQTARDAAVVRQRRSWWGRLRGRLPGGAAAGVVCVPGEVAAAAADLLWANMSLHLEPDPPALLARWHRALAPEGFLMFTTLGPGTLATLASLYGQASWPPPFAPFVDMHDLGDMLVEAGFADPVMDQEVLTLTWPDAHAALAELRGLGGNAHPGRHAGLRTARWREALLQALAGTAGADGRPQLEFELVYGHAFRVARGPKVTERTAVPLEDMRAMVRRGRGA